MALKFLVKTKINSMIDLFLNYEPQLKEMSHRLLDELPSLMSETDLSDQELLDLAQVLTDKGK